MLRMNDGQRGAITVVDTRVQTDRRVDKTTNYKITTQHLVIFLHTPDSKSLSK